MRLQVFVAVLVLVTLVHSKVVKNSINSNSQWVFLADFCYSKSPVDGSLTYTIYTDQDTTGMLFLMYDDQAPSWPHLQSTSNCAEKIALAKGSQQFVNGEANFVEFQDTQASHYWYFAVSNCNATVDIVYDMTMLNPGGKWSRQFSFDEQGMEALYLFYFIAFALGIAVQLYAVWQLMQSKSFHSIVQILTVSIVLEGLSILCYFIHYAVYANDGQGVPGLEGIGELLDIGMQLTLILLLMLIANGWSISKTQLDNKRVLLGGMGALAVAYVTLFIWENVGRNPASTSYIYDSAPGIIILVIRGLAMVWFGVSVYRTYLEENHPTKRRFYRFFGISFLAWFLTLPIIVIIAVSINAPCYRFKTTRDLYVTANAISLLGLGYLLWPTRAMEYFQISSRLDLAGTIPYDAI